MLSLTVFAVAIRREKLKTLVQTLQSINLSSEKNVVLNKPLKEDFFLFNNTLNTFYLWLHGILTYDNGQSR